MISKKTLLIAVIFVLGFMAYSNIKNSNIKEPFYVVPWQPYIWDSYGNYRLNYRNAHFWYKDRYYPFVNKYVFYDPDLHKFYYYDRYLAYKHYLNYPVHGVPRYLLRTYPYGNQYLGPIYRTKVTNTTRITN